MSQDKRVLNQLASALQSQAPSLPDISSAEQQKLATKAILKNVVAYVDNTGAKTFFAIDQATNTARNMTLDQVVDGLAKGFEDAGIHGFMFPKLSELAKTWSLTAPRINEIPPSVTTHDDELAFIRINTSKLDASLPTPTWDHFIENCGENGGALMAFTWSVFTREAYHSQYLFLKGDGKNGKGSYVRWLQNLVSNDNYQAYAALDASNERWPAMLIGKRLGVFNEINNTAIVMSSQFKQITGGDVVTINPKNVKAFSAKLDTLFVLTTNNDIMITGSEAEKRRAIIINLTPSDKVISNYEANLEAETWGFLAKCKQKFEELYDNEMKRIACNYKDFEEEAEATEEHLEFVFNEIFEYEEGAQEVTADDFHRLVGERFKPNSFDFKNFKTYVKRKYNVIKVRESGGLRRRVYQNIKVRRNRVVVNAFTGKGLHAGSN